MIMGENNSTNTILNDVMPTEIYASKSGGKGDRVLNASDKGNGHLYLSFAKPISRDYSGGRIVGEIFEIANGFHATKKSKNAASENEEYQAVPYGKNIDNATKVSGEKNATFFIKSYLKENGFKFNRSQKAWIK